LGVGLSRRVGEAFNRAGRAFTGQLEQHVVVLKDNQGELLLWGLK
jgi:hypothetical protein